MGHGFRWGTCGYQQTDIQLYGQQVVGFSSDSQPYLPVVACPFLPRRYSYRYRYIGLRLGAQFDFPGRKSYPAVIGKFGPPFPSLLLWGVKGSERKNTRHFILIANGQVELCCVSREEGIYFYLGGGDAKAKVLSQSQRRQEDDQQSCDERS